MANEQLPNFVRRDGNSILFDGNGELQYYIPENYFSGRNAIIEGSYVRLFGSFTYRIVSTTGSLGQLKVFNWPTAFLCRPTHITKEKDMKLEPNVPEGNYRILGFENGDQLVTNIFTPQDIDNTQDLLSLHIMTGKIPPTISYYDLYMYPYDSIALNGSRFEVHSQMMGLIYSKICRDPDDISQPFRLSSALDKDPKSFIPMSIKEVPKYISPYAAITSENIDEGIVSSVVMTDNIEEGKSEHRYSPLEKVLTM